jgi:hypothetical protein
MTRKPTDRKPQAGRGATVTTRTIPSFKSKRDNIVAGRPTVRQRAELRPPAEPTPSNPRSGKKPRNSK